jgi:hypothetical protein
MSSLKLIEANLRNALKSTGPRSPEGKARSARNALKHGLFTEEVVIRTGDGREDPAQYEAMYAGLQQDLRPVGQLEKLLVEKIAVNYWRLRRLVRYETGAVRRHLERYIRETIERYYQRLSSVPGGEPRPALQHLAYGDDVTDDDIARQAARVEQVSQPDYPLDEAVRAIALQNQQPAGHPDGDDDTGHREGEEDAGLDGQEDAGLDPERLGLEIGALAPAEAEALRQQFVERERQILAEMYEVRRWSEQLDLLARTNCTPGLDAADKVVKYEAALERSVFRNLDVLLHVQRARRERAAEDAGGQTQDRVVDARYSDTESGFVLDV